MPHKKKPPVSDSSSIHAARDVIMGNQVNQSDLTRVEALLEKIISSLVDPHRTIRVEGDVSRSILVTGNNNELCISQEDMGLLGTLQRGDNPILREKIYLTRYILDDTYAKWEQGYLPLAGNIIEPSLRMKDSQDQNISSAGLQVTDVSQVIEEYHKPHLVILGEPGAGKTTALERMALDLATKRLQSPLGSKLPIWVNLYKFTDENEQPSDFLKKEWENKTNFRESYAEYTNRGEVCFLLDGLNQMPWEDRVKRIERWAHWASYDLPPGNWAVFTCRSADYQHRLGLPEVHIQHLDYERIRRYLRLRFDLEKADIIWKDFDLRLHSGDDHFEKLARNPFMLSLLVECCEEGKAFTGNRGMLIEGLASRLLERELGNESYARQPRKLLDEPQRTIEAAMPVLIRLAFAMQPQGEGTSLSKPDVVKVYSEMADCWLSLEEFLHLTTGATVLVEEGTSRKDSLKINFEQEKTDPIYRFYHHLLQEYFAARQLIDRFRHRQNLSEYWRVPWRNRQLFPKRLTDGEQIEAPATTKWNETVVMAAGLSGEQAIKFINAVAADNLPLAGRCLAEAVIQRDDLQPLVKEIRTALLNRQRNLSASLPARIDAGLALGELGHPELLPQPIQFEGKQVWAIVPPLQPVAAGEFLHGSDPADKQAYSDEYTTERRVYLSEFSIARYPVTNAEYKLFIDSDGYQDDRWWDEGGIVWKQGGSDAHQESIQDWLKTRKWLQGQDLQKLAKENNWTPQTYRFWKSKVSLSEEVAAQDAQRLFERPFDRPAFWADPDLSNAARPVVGVNWYEAQAYCRWLSAMSERAFRLPAETEWEKAARGTDGRVYPWDNKFDQNYCNTVESHIYTTTPVGLYPNGVSPYGLFDAGGNVWEWTEDWYQVYAGGDSATSDDFGEKCRVLRGGSWDLSRRYARCACRSRHYPDDFSDVIGFRVVSPGPNPAS